MTKKLNTFQRVRELEGWHAVAFAVTLTERMLPNYELFCQLAEQDDDGQCRRSLNAAWEYLASPKSKFNFGAQIDKVEEVTPDAAEHDSYGVYPAIDAAIALVSTLQLIRGDDPTGAVVVSKLSQGSVEAFIEASEQTEMDNAEIKAHPLMQWEVAFQQSLLDSLADMKPGSASVKQLRESATEDGVSNLGIERLDAS